MRPSKLPEASIYLRLSYPSVPTPLKISVTPPSCLDQGLLETMDVSHSSLSAPQQFNAACCPHLQGQGAGGRGQGADKGMNKTSVICALPRRDRQNRIYQKKKKKNIDV